MGLTHKIPTFGALFVRGTWGARGIFLKGLTYLRDLGGGLLRVSASLSGFGDAAEDYERPAAI